MKSCWIIIGLLLLVTEYTYAESKQYSWKDLKALKEQSEWSELLQHGKEIPPSGRNKEWEELIRLAASKKMEALILKEKIPEMLDWSVAILDKYPHLHKHRPFMTYRATAALKVFPDCFANSYSVGHCHRKFLKFVLMDPNNSDLAYQAGKIVRQKMTHHYALPFFEMALRLKTSRVRFCKDSDIALAVISGLSLPDRREASDKKEIAKKIGLSWCWSELKKGLSQEVPNGSGYYLQTVCPKVSKAGLLSAAGKKTCKKYLK